MTSRDPEIPFAAEFAATLEYLFAMRRDIRGFRPDPLPEHALEQLLAIACLAPSVGLSQPWRFVIVDTPARRARLRDIFAACNAEALAACDPERAPLYATLKLAGLDEAPAQVSVFVDRAAGAGHGLGRQTMPETADYSVVMAIHTLWLAARARGIGVGWVSILDPILVRAALDVPDHWHLIGHLCIGYPRRSDDTPELARRGWEHRQPAASFILRR